jgi:hypothetical protein
VEQDDLELLGQASEKYEAALQLKPSSYKVRSGCL